MKKIILPVYTLGCIGFSNARPQVYNQMSEKHKTVYQKFYEEVVPCLSEKCQENCDLENVESFFYVQEIF